MWTVIAGWDQTGIIPFDTSNLQQTINDPAANLTFDVRDDAAVLSFSIGDEVIVWNENAPPEKTLSLRSIAAIPSHNFTFPLPSGWTTTGGIASIVNNGGFPATMTFANTTYSSGNNTGFVTCTTPSGYIHPGQQYMLSVYVTIASGTPLVNANCIIKIDFLDGAGTLIGASTVSTTFTTTTNNTQQQISIIATAPSNAAQIVSSFGGQATVSGTNGGLITFGAAQLEPMWFVARGISYPTPDINSAQADCTLMPDNTCSRTVRLFSGTISNIKKDYIGPCRTWHMQCAGAGAILENGIINAVFTGQYDTSILTSIITTYFSNQIAINAANVVTPLPLSQGAFISAVSYVDNTLREVLNGMIDASGYTVFLDQYYRLYYQPQYSSSANFMLSDSPDNVTSFPYYNYQIEIDGTQLKRNIKINGGKFAGYKQDIFSGNGSTKQFALTYIPNTIALLTVGGVAQRVGVYGRDTFSGPFDVLVNMQSQYILFNTAPANSANNTLCGYPYQAPITTQTTISTNGVIAPGYTKSTFDAKVNDTNITDLTTATSRGLAEIVKYGSPLQLLTFSSQQFAPAGQAVFFTSASDGILIQPFIVQSVTGIMLGKSLVLNSPVNEFQYQAGSYSPGLIDHIRNTAKAVNRASTVANATVAQQFDFVAMETIGYRDSITPTAQSTFAINVYGTGHYGNMAYGGASGLYGSTAHYNLSTIYG